MAPGIIKQINWLDIFILIILVRVSYVAIKTGFPLELFKTLGVILAVCLSLHYYSGLSAFAFTALGHKNIPPALLDLLFLIVLAGATLLTALILRKLIFRFVKMEAVSGLNKWGGFILGIAKGLLFSSLIVFIFVISTVGYLKKSVTASYSGGAIFKIAPVTYARAFNGIISKFFSAEKFNQAVSEAKKGLNK